MRKLLTIGLALLLVLGAGGFFAARYVLANFVTADYLVSQLETSYNCRAEIAEMDLKLFRRPSRIELTSVSLSPRDDFARNGTPLAERAPLEQTAIHCDSVTLEASLLDLLRRKLTVDRLLVSNFKAQVLLKADGSTSLDAIFDSPEDHDTLPASTTTAAVVAPPPPAVAPAGATPLTATPPATAPAPPVTAPAAPATGEPEGFNASEMQVAAFADSVAIDGGTIYAVVEKNGSTILIDNIQVAVSDIDIDPAALDEHNSASLTLSALLGVDSKPEEGIRYAELQLEGNGKLNVFNPQTGIYDPRLNCELTIREGSYIDTLPTLDAVAGLFEKLEEIGIDAKELDLFGDFTQASTTRIEYYGGVVKTSDLTTLHLRENRLELVAGSWINANSNAHLLEGSVIVSEAKTAEAVEEVDKFLKEKASFIANPQTRDLILKPVMRDGRVTLGFRSHGDLSDPQVDLLTEIGTISNILKIGESEGFKQIEREGKKLLEGLKGLFK